MATDENGNEIIETPPPAPPVAPPGVTPEQFATVQSELEAVREQMKQAQALNAHYASELGKARQAPPAAAKTDDVASRFDDVSKRFVREEAERIVSDRINTTLGKLSVQAEVNQTIGNDPELSKEAMKQYQVLKQNPYYANQPEEMLMAYAADRAKGAILENRLKATQTELVNAKKSSIREEQIQDQMIPGTSSRWPTPTAEDPDADLKYYMKQPESQQIFKKLFGGVDPFSNEEVRFIEAANAPRYKAIDAYKLLAARAVRRGSQVGPNLQALLNSQGGN